MLLLCCAGPDGLRQHRQSVLDPDYVGEGNWGWTPERTSSAFYVMRAAPETPHPRPKSSYSDAYGFGCWGPSAAMCSWRHKDHAIKVRAGHSNIPNRTPVTFDICKDLRQKIISSFRLEE